MPKRGEKQRKLKALSQMKGVRPPKRWFKKMMDRTTRQYPRFGLGRKAQIVGGIWSKASVSTKRKIIKKYQR